MNVIKSFMLEEKKKEAAAAKFKPQLNLTYLDIYDLIAKHKQTLTCHTHTQKHCCSTFWPLSPGKPLFPSTPYRWKMDRGAAQTVSTDWSMSL